MFVRYWMTKPAKTVARETDLAQALEMMRKHKIRRLPVVQGGKVLGMLTASDLYHFAGPHLAKMTSVPEHATDEMKKHTVSEIMSPDPFFCDPNTTLEDAGDAMRREKLGALPVVENGTLVGIITESDVLAALTKIARLDGNGRRVCFKIPTKEKSQFLYKIMDVCILNDLDILTVLTHPLGEETQLVMMRIKGESLDHLVKELRENNYDLLLIGESAKRIKRVSNAQ